MSQQAQGNPFRIDVHHHSFPPQFMAEQLKLKPAGDARRWPVSPQGWSPAYAVEELDRSGTATAILQMVADPGVWFGDVAAARRLAREWNEYTAQMMRDHPGRFGMFACMPMPDVDSTLQEIAYALDVLKADGVQFMSHYEGRYPGDPRFRPILEELNRRKAVVMIHPFLPPSHDVLPGILPRNVEFPFDTTRAIVSLVLNGTVAQLPDIRFIFCHGGGTIPMLSGRIDQLTKGEKDRAERLPRGLEYELKKFYYETANAYHPATFAALETFAAGDHILFGTDYPYVSAATNAGGLAKAARSPAQLGAIESANAAKLFPRFARA
jgi:predicted TIM-barrel fold metal-dependent hydrolase